MVVCSCTSWKSIAVYQCKRMDKLHVWYQNPLRPGHFTGEGEKPLRFQGECVIAHATIKLFKKIYYDSEGRTNYFSSWLKYIMGLVLTQYYWVVFSVPHPRKTLGIFNRL